MHGAQPISLTDPEETMAVRNGTSTKKIQTNGHSQGLEQVTIEQIATIPVEFRQLAASFTTMADQVQNLVSDLQRRVIERTADLQAVAEVSSRVANIRSADELLQSVADLAKA